MCMYNYHQLYTHFESRNSSKYKNNINVHESMKFIAYNQVAALKH